VFANVTVAYGKRYSTPTMMIKPTASSTGPSYAGPTPSFYALAAQERPTPPQLAGHGQETSPAGLRKLAGGPTKIEVGSHQGVEAFEGKLTAGEKNQCDRDIQPPGLGHQRRGGESYARDVVHRGDGGHRRFLFRKLGLHLRLKLNKARRRVVQGN